MRRHAMRRHATLRHATKKAPSPRSLQPGPHLTTPPAAAARLLPTRTGRATAAPACGPPPAMAPAASAKSSLRAGPCYSRACCRCCTFVPRRQCLRGPKGGATTQGTCAALRCPALPPPVHLLASQLALHATQTASHRHALRCAARPFAPSVNPAAYAPQQQGNQSLLLPPIDVQPLWGPCRAPTCEP